MDEPLKFIEALRDTDEYLQYIYTQGSCYKFTLFLTKIYPEGKVVINKAENHCAALINGKVYDILGLNEEEDFFDITDYQREIAATWSFWGHHFLILDECPHCEEPITIDVT